VLILVSEQGKTTAEFKSTLLLLHWQVVVFEMRGRVEQRVSNLNERDLVNSCECSAAYQGSEEGGGWYFAEGWIVYHLTH
jgi:hypothetical protein